MNVYTCNDFAGFYPVPTAAVVVAPDEATALSVLEDQLKLMGLRQHTPITVQLLDVSRVDVAILSSGEY